MLHALRLPHALPFLARLKGQAHTPGYEAIDAAIILSLTDASDNAFPFAVAAPQIKIALAMKAIINNTELFMVLISADEMLLQQ